MENHSPRITRADRLWLRACGVVFLMTFVTVAVLMTIVEHRFARAHSLQVDYNAFAGQIVFAGGPASICIVVYVFAIPSRLILNLCLPSRWHAYRWETVWLLIAFGMLSWAVYAMATTKMDGDCLKSRHHPRQPKPAFSFTRGQMEALPVRALQVLVKTDTLEV